MLKRLFTAFVFCLLTLKYGFFLFHSYKNKDLPTRHIYPVPKHSAAALFLSTIPAIGQKVIIDNCCTVLE
jgi:hypothetical protein